MNLPGGLANYWRLWALSLDEIGDEMMKLHPSKLFLTFHSNHFLLARRIVATEL